MGTPGTPPSTPPPPATGGPWWLNPVVTLTTQVGFPVIVAGALLWFLLTRFMVTLDTITQRLVMNTTVASDLMREQQSTTAQLVEQTKLMESIAKNAEALARIRIEELELLKRKGARDDSP